MNNRRLRVVRQVLYLIFNEGYVASAGEELQRTNLSAEGIRLARLLRRLLPDDAETAGLLALMRLTDARRAARVTPDGALVTMVHGPAAGLAATDELADTLARHHRFHAVRGHLIEMSGDTAAAASAYALAARYATNTAEKRYLDRLSRRTGGHLLVRREPRLTRLHHRPLLMNRFCDRPNVHDFHEFEKK
jgi:predicted RNA polymerase sigma factor